MHLVYPQKFCITIVFDFLCDDCYTYQKLEGIVIQNLAGAGGGGGGGVMVKHGALWSM